MNLIIYIVQVIYVIVVVSCYTRGNKKDYFDFLTAEDSSDYNDNEVNNIPRLEENQPSGEHKNKEHIALGLNQTWQNFRQYFVKETKEKQEYVPVRETLLQSSTEVEEDDDETKRTLIDYPFSVSVQKKGAHYVSGALIDKSWILSVAGEFYNVRESLKLFRARLGSVDCKRGGSLVPIKRIEIHPYYVYRKPNFDVALLRLAMPVEYSNVVGPIGISNVKGKVLSAKFMTTYWPRIVLNGRTLAETATERIKYNSMRVSTQRLIPTDKCKNIMTAVKEVIIESTLCLKPVVTHHSICVPDAGAPVIAKDGLWGITSGWIASTCPNFAAPTVFTRLSSGPVRSWLDTHLLEDVINTKVNYTSPHTTTASSVGYDIL